VGDFTDILLWYSRRISYMSNIQVIAGVYMAARNRVIANIPVLNGLLAACKRSH